VVHLILDLCTRHPALLCSFLLLWIFEIGDMSNSLRQFVFFGREIARKYLTLRLDEGVLLLLAVVLVV
jgi:hypothetical protein